jgi:hypothetical protein
LAGVLSDENGDGGGFVRATNTALTTPSLGVATATSINKVALTAPATSATLTVANGKTLTASNTLTLAGTDGTTMTFPATSGAVQTLGSGVVAIPWSAAGVETDGTNCAAQTQSQVASGVRIQDFGCVTFASGAGAFYGVLEMRPAWSFSATMPFTLRIRTIGTSSVAWVADVALWCFSDGNTFPSDTNFDSATPQEINITTGTTPNVRVSDTTAAITPGGTCAADDSVAFRVKTKTGHTATAATAKVVGGLLAATYLRFAD